MLAIELRVVHVSKHIVESRFNIILALVIWVFIPYTIKPCYTSIKIRQDKIIALEHFSHASNTITQPPYEFVADLSRLMWIKLTWSL